MKRIVRVAAFAGLCGILMTGCAHNYATIPTSYTTFTPLDKAFICDAPGKWSTDSTASGAVESSGHFASGDASIDVSCDLAGSLFGDIASSQNNQAANLAGGTGQAPAYIPPVEKVHAQAGIEFQRRLDHYTELSTIKISSQYGDARLTEFTAKDVHGYRATILGRDKRIAVDCEGSPGEWKKLQPVFMDVISSIKPGANQ